MADLTQFHSNAPAPMVEEAATLARKRAIAESMMQQSMQPLKSQEVGGRVVPIGMGEGLAQIGKALLAAYSNRAVSAQEGDLAKRYQSGIVDAMSKYSTQSQGTPSTTDAADNIESPGVAADPRGAVTGALTSPYGVMRDFGKIKEAEFARKEQHAADLAARSDMAREAQLARSADQMENRRSIEAVAEENRKARLQQSAEHDARNSAMRKELQEGPQIKLKPGERFKPGSGNSEVEAIPGSDTYITQSRKHAVDVAAAKAMNAASTNAINKIDYILDKKNESAFNRNFGGYNAQYLTQHYPDAQDMRGKLESMKNDMKKAGLDIIRAGGSIGQMTEKEWPIVRDMIDAITPMLSEKNARVAVEGVQTYLRGMRDRANSTYHDEWSRTQFHKPDIGLPTQAASAPTSGLTPAQEAELARREAIEAQNAKRP